MEEKKPKGGWKQKVYYLLVMIVLIYLLEWWAVWGIVIFILAIAAKRLYDNRVSFFMSLKNIECMIWGKPLDKDMWDKGEMKNTKVKIVWRKKKDEVAKPTPDSDQ